MSRKMTLPAKYLIELDKQVFLPSKRKIVLISHPSVHDSFLTCKDNPFIETHSFMRGEITNIDDPLSLCFTKVEIPKTPRLTKGGNNIIKKISVEDLNKEYSRIQNTSLPDILENHISLDDCAFMYIISTFTVNNYFGCPSPKSCSPNELYPYIDQIIPLDTKTKLSCFDKSAIIRSPEFVIDVAVIEVSVLKNPGSFLNRQFFCKTWLSSNKRDTKVTKTVPVSSTWNSHYRFKIDSSEDILNFEVYSKNPGVQGFVTIEKEDNSPTKVEISDTSEGNLFGKATIKVTDIYSEGIDMWIPLKFLKRGVTKGYMHFAAKIDTLRLYGGLKALKIHLMLMRLCLQDAVKFEKTNRYIASWSQILSPSATTLVFLHSVIGSIPPCEDYVCWFVVMNSIASRSVDLSFKFCFNLLDDCDKTLKVLYDNQNTIEPTLFALYKKEVRELNKRCAAFLKNLHAYNFSGNKNKSRDFEFALKTIDLSNGICDTGNDPVAILKYEAYTWLESTADNVSQMTSEEKPVKIVELLEQLKEFQTSVDKAYRNVYTDSTYTNVIFENLKHFLCGTLKCQIKDISTASLYSNDHETLNPEGVINVYVKAHHLFSYINKVIKFQASEIQHELLRDWFGEEVLSTLFAWRKDLASSQIKMALRFDDHENPPLGLKNCTCSPSFKVVPDIIHKQLIEFWTLVSQPRSKRCDTIFVRCLDECCMLYASSILEKYPSWDFYYDNIRNRRRRMFIMSNNLYRLLNFVQKTIEDTVGLSFCHFLNTTHNLQLVCQRSYIDTSDRIAPDVMKRIEQVVRSKNKLQQVLALRKYRNLVARIVWKEAFCHMDLDGFERFLSVFWSQIVKKMTSSVGIEETNGVPELEGNAMNRSDVTERQHLSRLEGLLKVLGETKKFCSRFKKRYELKLMWNSEMDEAGKKLEAKLNTATVEVQVYNADGS